MDTADVLAWRDGHIEALDQTVLPHETRVLTITTVDELVEAITRLALRGAPVLGAAGALGEVMALHQAERDAWAGARLDAEIERIAAARPTAVNLRREVRTVAARARDGRDAATAAAHAVLDANVAASLDISPRGAAYLTRA